MHPLHDGPCAGLMHGPTVLALHAGFTRQAYIGTIWRAFRPGSGVGSVHGRHAPPRSANLCAGANSPCPCRADMWGNAQVSRLPGRVCVWGNLPIPPAGAACAAMCRFHMQDQHGRIIYRATAPDHAPHRVHAGRDVGERVPSACSVHWGTVFVPFPLFPHVRPVFSCPAGYPVPDRWREQGNGRGKPGLGGCSPCAGLAGAGRIGAGHLHDGLLE